MPLLKCHRCDRSSLPSLVVLSLVLMWGGFSCRPAAGQAARTNAEPAPAGPAAAAAHGPRDYLQDQVDEALKSERIGVQRMLRAGAFAAGEQEVFDRYYRQYVLARWTLPKNGDLLAGYRNELRNNLKTAKRSEVHDHLNTLVLAYMSERAKRDFHPATRYNAMLMIGELNAVEAPRPSDLPVPLPAARQVLLQTIDEKQQPQAVKVAALVGILRHAEIGIADPAARKQVSDAMLKLAQSKSSEGGSVAGHAWMRGQAAEVLGHLKAVGEGGAVVRALVAIVAESGLPFSTRCSAAEALGKLHYQGAAALNASASEFATVLGQLAVDAIEAEGQAAKVFARRLKYRINAALIGLTGEDENQNGGITSLAAGPPHQAFVAGLRNSLKTTLGLIDDKQDGDELIKKVNTEAARLRSSLTPKAATKKAETDKGKGGATDEVGSTS